MGEKRNMIYYLIYSEFQLKFYGEKNSHVTFSPPTLRITWMSSFNWWWWSSLDYYLINIIFINMFHLLSIMMKINSQWSIRILFIHLAWSFMIQEMGKETFLNYIYTERCIIILFIIYSESSCLQMIIITWGSELFFLSFMVIIIVMINMKLDGNILSTLNIITMLI